MENKRCYFNKSITLQRLCVFLIPILLSSCAGKVFYDAERSELSTQIEETYQKIDLLIPIKAERANQLVITKAELEAVSRLIKVAHDSEIYSIVDSKNLKEGYEQRIIQRRNKIIGKANANQWTALSLNEEPNIERRITPFTTKYQVSPPSCNSISLNDSSIPKSFLSTMIKKNPQITADNQLLNFLWNEYYMVCKDFKDVITENKIAKLDKNNALRKVFDKWNQELKKIETKEDEAEDAKTSYDDSLNSYNSAVKTLDKANDIQGNEEKIKIELEKVSKTAKLLGKDANPFGIKLLSDNKIKQIDTILVALTGKPLDENEFTDEQRKSLTALGTMVPLYAEFLSTIQRASRPRIEPLLLEKERLRILSDTASLRVKRLKQKVIILEQRYLAYVYELRLLRKAYQSLSFAKNNTKGCNIDIMSVTLMKALLCNTDVSHSLYRSIALYGNSISIARLNQIQTEYELISLTHEQSLDNSERAAALWNAIIATPISQLAAYYKGGIKEAELAALIGQFAIAAGTFGIAAGVN